MKVLVNGQEDYLPEGVSYILDEGSVRGTRFTLRLEFKKTIRLLNKFNSGGSYEFVLINDEGNPFLMIEGTVSLRRLINESGDIGVLPPGATIPPREFSQEAVEFVVDNLEYL